jgi:hypothetical protein
VEAPGIENERGRTARTISRRGCTIRHEGALGTGSGRASKCADGGGVGTESSQLASAEYELRGVVEPALARVLMLAADAERWELVAQIAAELAARRRTREGRRRPRRPDIEMGASSARGANVPMNAADLKLGAGKHIR